MRGVEVPAYRYAGLIVASTLRLDELERAEANERAASDISCALLPDPPREPAGEQWTYRWDSNEGIPSLSLARTQDGLLLRFAKLADFTISAGGRRIGAWPAQGTTSATLRHLLLDQVLPRVLAHMGRLVLHASAVRLQGGSIAFLGPTGTGKSTLAASFHATGFPLISDDALVLRPTGKHVLALPTYTGLRLWPRAVAGVFSEMPNGVPMAHYSTKQRLLMDEAGHPTATTVIAALILKPNADAGCHGIWLRELSSQDTFVSLLRNSFQLDVTDRYLAANLFATVGTIATRVRALELCFPLDFPRLPEVRAAILERVSPILDGIERQTVSAEY